MSILLYHLRVPVAVLCLLLVCPASSLNAQEILGGRGALRDPSGGALMPIIKFGIKPPTAMSAPANQPLKIKPPTQSQMDEALRLGYRYLASGRNKNAVAVYQRAVRLDQADAEAHNNLGLAYGQLGRFKDAIRELTTAIRLNPATTKRTITSVLFICGWTS